LYKSSVHVTQKVFPRHSGIKPVLLSRAVAYGIWSGLGMALVAGLGVMWFGERLTWRRVCGLVLIGTGVALANQG
ncbi:MAG: SMR family transporter, partial [Synechococcus sp.]|nr:SMR family transporter [Synechococcus sp.]